MEMLIGLVATVMALGIPLAAILGSVYLKAKRLRAEGGAAGELGQRLTRVEAENAALRTRVEVLEDIATMDRDAATGSRVRVAAQAAKTAHDDNASQDDPASPAAARRARMG